MMAIPHERMLNLSCVKRSMAIFSFEIASKMNRYIVFLRVVDGQPHLEIGEEAEDVVDAITQAQWRYAQKHFPFAKDVHLQNIQNGVRYKHIHAMVYQ